MTDPIAAARDVMARAEALLVNVPTARVALAAAGELTGDGEAELVVYATMLAAFVRGLIAALEEVVADLKKAKGDALLVVADGLYVRHRARLAELAGRYRLPSMHGLREHVEAASSCPTARPSSPPGGEPPSS